MKSLSNSFNSASNTEWVQSSNHSLNTAREQAIFSLGKEKGAEELKKEISDIYISLLTRSYEDTTKVLSVFKYLQLDVLSARLKVDSLNSLRVMIALRPNDKLFESLDTVYNHLYDVEEEINNDDYHVTFSIIKAFENSFSDASVENDGYIYKHRLSLDEKTTRPA